MPQAPERVLLRQHEGEPDDRCTKRGDGASRHEEDRHHDDGDFGGNYIDTAGLTDEEKEQAWLHLQRFSTGIIEEKIPRDELQAIGLPIDENNEWLPLTDEELRALIARMKEHADAAEIPNEWVEHDVAGALEDAANQVLGEGWDSALGSGESK